MRKEECLLSKELKTTNYTIDTSRTLNFSKRDKKLVYMPQNPYVDVIEMGIRESTSEAYLGSASLYFFLMSSISETEFIYCTKDFGYNFPTFANHLKSSKQIQSKFKSCLYIATLDVDANHQNQGIGTMFLNTIPDAFHSTFFQLPGCIMLSPYVNIQSDIDKLAFETKGKSEEEIAADENLSSRTEHLQNQQDRLASFFAKSGYKPLLPNSKYMWKKGG